LLNPVCLLILPFSAGNDEIWYPGVVIDDVSLGAVAGWEGNCVSVSIQSSFEVAYFVSKAKVSQGVLFFSFSDGGSEALGNVENSSRVVLVELHHMFGRARGDGSCRSHGGPYGGRRANGHFDQRIDGDGRHSLGSVGVMIGTGVVFAEVCVDEGMVRRLVVDPQEKELSQLEVGLELKGDDSEGNCARGEGF
jgi:hypothetical protein